MTKENEMPDEIWAWMGLQDNGSWDARQDVCTPPATKYVRAQPLPVDRQEALDGIIEHLDHLDLCMMRVRVALGKGERSGVNLLAEFREFCEAGIADKLRAALSKPNDVGVEGIKREVVNLPSVYKINSLQRAEEYEDRLRCIGHLQSQGYLSQPKEEWRDELNLYRDTIKKIDDRIEYRDFTKDDIYKIIDRLTEKLKDLTTKRTAGG